MTASPGSGKVIEPSSRISGSLPTNRPSSSSGFDNLPANAGGGARIKPGSNQPGSPAFPSQSGTGTNSLRTNTIPGTNYNAGADGSTPSFKSIPESSRNFPSQDGSGTPSSRFKLNQNIGTNDADDNNTPGSSGNFPSQNGSDTPSSSFNKIPNIVTSTATDGKTPGYNNIPGIGSSTLPGFKRIPDNRVGAPDTSSNLPHGSQLPVLSQTLPGESPRHFDQLQTDSNGLTPNNIQPGSDSQSDIMARLRAAFKLPPGFCLVRCDSLKTSQISLTPDQVKDAFTAAGLFGKIE